MKYFSLLLEDIGFALFEHKEWHQFIKQNGDRILQQLGMDQDYLKTKEESDHGLPSHKTEYIKTKLSLHDAPKHHGKWILGQLSKGGIERAEDIQSTILPHLKTFEETKDIHGINLKNVNNRTELFNIVSKHQGTLKEPEGLVHGTDYTLLGENEHWKVIEPHTKKAACGFGSGTNWCTSASGDNNMFSFYNQNGPMQILLPKNPRYRGEKYQFHASSGQFMNHEDSPVNEKNKSPLPIFRERQLPNFTNKDELTLDLKTRDIFSHPNSNDEELDEIFNHPSFNINNKKYSQLISSSKNKSLKLKTLSHPSYNGDNLYDFLGFDDEEVQSKASSHPRFHEENNLTAALRSNFSSIRNKGLNSKNFKDLPHNYISRLLTSKHTDVTKKLIDHANFGTPDHFSRISDNYNGNSEILSKTVKHPLFGKNIQSYRSFVPYLTSNDRNIRQALTNHPEFKNHRERHEALIEASHQLHALGIHEITDKDAAKTAIKDAEDMSISVLEHPLPDPYHITRSFYHPNVNVAKKAVEAATRYLNDDIPGSGANSTSELLKDRGWSIGRAQDLQSIPDWKTPRRSSSGKAPLPSDVNRDNIINAAMRSKHLETQKYALSHPSFAHSDTYIKSARFEDALRSHHEEIVDMALNHPEIEPHHFKTGLNNEDINLAKKIVNHPSFNKTDRTNVSYGYNSRHPEISAMFAEEYDKI